MSDDTIAPPRNASRENRHKGYDTPPSHQRWDWLSDAKLICVLRRLQPLVLAGYDRFGNIKQQYTEAAHELHRRLVVAGVAR